MNPTFPTLHSFELRNFKLFRSAKIVLHPDVTVLVGLNDVGKSCLLEAIHLYGRIQGAGFRGPLSDDRFSTSGEDVTQFIAEWKVDDKLWTHRIVLDVDNPEERLEHQGKRWSWNPKERRLTTGAGSYSAPKQFFLYRTLAQIDESRWKLDTDIDEADYEPLSVIRNFQTPPAYLFEPSLLGRPAPLDIEEPQRNGFGWVIWLQEIINRRNDDLASMEAEIRELFPFFARVRVREKRVRIETDESVLGEQDTNRTMDRLTADERDEAALQVFNFIKQQGSRREVFIELRPETTDGEQQERVDADDVSSGLLLALAHFALVYADKSGRLLLLEEPENGLNAKIALQMMQALLKAALGRCKQLVLTTHNGWWLDLVPAEGIRVLTRDADGARIHGVDPEALRAWREEHDVYPSELMSTYGPEGLLTPPATRTELRG